MRRGYWVEDDSDMYLEYECDAVRPFLGDGDVVCCEMCHDLSGGCHGRFINIDGEDYYVCCEVYEAWCNTDRSWKG